MNNTNKSLEEKYDVTYKRMEEMAKAYEPVAEPDQKSWLGELFDNIGTVMVQVLGAAAQTFVTKKVESMMDSRPIMDSRPVKKKKKEILRRPCER